MEPLVKENMLLISAITENNIAKVRELIPLCDIQAYHNEALHTAIRYRRMECIKVLLAAVTPPLKDNNLLVSAASNGDLAMVRLFLPVTDPKDQNSKALQVCAMHCCANPIYKPIVDFLFEVSDPEIALTEIQRQRPCEPLRWAYLEERVVQKRLRATLSATAEDVAADRQPLLRMKRL